MTVIDKTLADLVKKKKQLLDHLLQLSIKSVIDYTDTDSMMDQRKVLLMSLIKNDQAIETRECQTGIKARLQEKGLFHAMGVILKAIEENNQVAICRTEQEKKSAEAEKSTMKLTSKITNYVNQTKPDSRYGRGPGNSPYEIGTLKGVL